MFEEEFFVYTKFLPKLLGLTNFLSEPLNSRERSKKKFFGETYKTPQERLAYQAYQREQEYLSSVMEVTKKFDFTFFKNLFSLKPMLMSSRVSILRKLGRKINYLY